MRQPCQHDALTMNDGVVDLMWLRFFYASELMAAQQVMLEKGVQFRSYSYNQFSSRISSRFSIIFC